MAIDWIGFIYAGAILLGGSIGYYRRGSLMSLMAGVVFGGLAFVGAYQISEDSKNIRVSMIAPVLLSIIMGVRFSKSGKFVPAGIITGLSLMMVFRLLLLI